MFVVVTFDNILTAECWSQKFYYLCDFRTAIESKICSF